MDHYSLTPQWGCQCSGPCRLLRHPNWKDGWMAGCYLQKIRRSKLACFSSGKCLETRNKSSGPSMCRGMRSVISRILASMWTMYLQYQWHYLGSLSSYPLLPSLQLHDTSSHNEAVIFNGWQELWTWSGPCTGIFINHFTSVHSLYLLSICIRHPCWRNPNASSWGFTMHGGVWTSCLFRAFTKCNVHRYLHYVGTLKWFSE
jgi:hypothetical protein